MSFPHVRVEGSAHERGRQYGEEARDRIAASVDAYRALFEYHARWDWRTVTKNARMFAEAIAAYDHRYMEEICGIAEGANLDDVDIIALNARTEIMNAGGVGLAGGECSAMAALPEATVTGHTLIGQNWDWCLHAADTVIVLEVQQPEGPDYVTVVEAGLLAKTGFNSSGVGLVTNALTSSRDFLRLGVPYHVLLRGILDAENVVDAFDALQRAPRASSANYIIAHEDGVAANIEAAPGDSSQLFISSPEQGVLAHTNHFCSSKIDFEDVLLGTIPGSPLRLDRLNQCLKQEPRIAPETLQEAFSDHVHYPQGVCQHPDVRKPELEWCTTIASVVMDLDERCLWIADGPPCSTEYRQVDYSELLAKPRPLRTQRPDVRRGTEAREGPSR